jgi:hypothetical protein
MRDGGGSVRTILNRLEARLRRGWMWLRLREQPVLSPYVRQRTPLARTTRRGLLVALLIFIGMIYGVALVILPPYFLLFLAAPLVLLALIVIWALPDQADPPTGPMVKLLFGFLVVAVVWPNYLAVALPGLPWISLRRLMLAPMCLLLLISLSTSAQFRRQMGETLQASPLLWKLLGAFLVVQTLSIVMAEDRPEAIKDYVNYQTYWTAVFVVALFAFRQPRRVGRMFAVLIATAGFVALIAGAEWYNKGILWANHIPSFLKVDNPFLEGLLSGNIRGGRYRVATTFSHPLAFTEYMGLISPIVVHFIFTAQTMWRKLLFVLFDLVVLAAILSTQSRLGFSLFLLAHVIYCGFWAVRRWMVVERSLFGPAITLAFPALLAVFGVAVISVDALRLRVFGGGATAASNLMRQQQLDAWLPALLKSPPFGNGPRQGAEILGVTSSGKPSIDNYYIWISLDYGVLGLLLYYGMIAFMAWKAMQIGLTSRSRSEEYGIVSATILLLFLFSKTVLSQEDNHWLPFLLMGLTLAQLANAKAQAAASGVPRTFLGWKIV